MLHAEDALQKLQEKHPPASGRLDDLPDINPESALSVTEIEVRQAVLSFPAGSSGGPDGMRPQHLKDMMLCRESGTDFLAALTGFTNVVLAGLCPKEATLFFFGGRLLAMNKKSGGIGLIAVGVTLRRLASNVAILTARHAWLLVWPSTAQSRHSRGSEAAIHSARRYLQSLALHIMVKLDFANAFNSLHGSRCCQRPLTRELYAFCLLSYSQPLCCKTRSSAIAAGPRDASCQWKSCQLPRNSAETTYATSPDQIDGMKLEI